MYEHAIYNIYKNPQSTMKLENETFKVIKGLNKDAEIIYDLYTRNNT